jgi:linoleoyl-CoA desaturase
MKSIGIKFSNKDSREFTRVLKREVNAYFEENQISQRANNAMKLKTVALLSLVVVPYGLILSNQFSVWSMWGLVVLTALGVAGVGFSVTHDALHGSYSSNRKVNSVLGFALDFLGGSSYIWKLRHNVMHHTYTNIQGADVDLDVSIFIRLSPGSRHHPMQRYQKFYAFFAYCFATLHWVLVKDYINIFRRSMGPYRDIEHSRGQVALVIGMKLLYYFNTIALPLLVLDLTWWQFAIGLFTFHFTAGFILTVVFQLAHVVEGPSHYATEGDELMEDAWMIHQLRTTSNFARTNKPLSWFIGGLNYQIEHHLFPKICSIHYPAISPIVKRVAHEYGVPYFEQPTLRAAIVSHYRVLERLADPAVTPETFTQVAAK